MEPDEPREEVLLHLLGELPLTPTLEAEIEKAQRRLTAKLAMAGDLIAHLPATDRASTIEESSALIAAGGHAEASIQAFGPYPVCPAWSADELPREISLECTLLELPSGCLRLQVSIPELVQAMVYGKCAIDDDSADFTGSAWSKAHHLEVKLSSAVRCASDLTGRMLLLKLACLSSQTGEYVSVLKDGTPIRIQL